MYMYGDDFTFNWMVDYISPLPIKLKARDYEFTQIKRVSWANLDII